MRNQTRFNLFFPQWNVRHFLAQTPDLLVACLQNQQLLEKLTLGQELQLRLQSTVEGLSIAAISYYVVSLLLYVAKAGKAAGLPIHPELIIGIMIPIVIATVWYITRRIHNKFFKLN